MAPRALREWRPPSYYGWRIVALAAVTLMLTGPGQTIGMSVFVEEIVVDLDLSRSRVSLGYLIATLTSAFTLPVIGRGIDRFGVRAAMTLIGVAFAVAIASLAGIVGFVSMIAAFTALRMLGQGALTLTATTAVGLWFDQRRGMAVGIATAAGAGLMSLVPVLLAAAVGLVGWRGALLLAGPVVGLLVVAIGRLGMRDGPHELGLELDGRPAGEDRDPGRSSGTDGAGPDTAERSATRGWTGRQATRTMMFWALVVVFASPSMISTGLVFHQLSVLGEQGLTATQAAVAFVPYSLAAMAATLAAGALADRLPAQLLLVLPPLLLIGAMQLVPHVSPGALVVVYACLLGGSSGAARSLEPALIPKFYGLSHVGAIRGRMMSFKVGASALGPYALAVGFEHFAAYGQALMVLTILPATALVMALAAPRPGAAATTPEMEAPQ